MQDSLLLTRTGLGLGDVWVTAASKPTGQNAHDMHPDTRRTEAPDGKSSCSVGLRQFGTTAKVHLTYLQLKGFTMTANHVLSFSALLQFVTHILVAACASRYDLQATFGFETAAISK